jgi:hypothetical protein
MAHDPLSRVASWLTPATAETRHLPADDADPVLALIAEAARLDALWYAATNRGDEIEAENLGRRAREVGNQIRNTKPVTLAGAIAMLEWSHNDGCCDERVVNAAITGLRELARMTS